MPSSMERLQAVYRPEMSGRELAEAMGITYGHATFLLRQARDTGLVPSVADLDRNAMSRLIRYKNKGAPIRTGYLRDILVAMEPDDLDLLMDAARTDEDTLAATIARLLRERLHEIR